MQGRIVEDKDLIGYIKDFPIEVVQKMVDYQMEQGNPPNVSIFQKSNNWNRKVGGFSWVDTKVKDTRDGCINFWCSVLNHKNWGTFFKIFPKYPPKEALEDKVNEEEAPDLDFLTGELYVPKTKVEVDINDEGDFENPFDKFSSTTEDEQNLPNQGDIIIVSDTNYFGINERVFLAYIKELPHPVITVTKESWDKLIAGDNKANIRVCTYKYYKEKPKEQIVELTLEDISKGKGVGVPAHLIKIVNK